MTNVVSYRWPLPVVVRWVVPSPRPLSAGPPSAEPLRQAPCANGPPLDSPPPPAGPLSPPSPSPIFALRVLGVPMGHPEFIKEFLLKKSREHAALFERIPWVNDPQAAYFLLLMSGSTRANFLLRTVKRNLTEEFAIRHDSAVWRCLCTILGTPSAPMDAQVLASLSFSGGCLGLASAHRVRTAAHFASCADRLIMVRKRHPHIAATMIRNLVVGTSRTRSRLQKCGGGCWVRCALLE